VEPPGLEDQIIVALRRITRAIDLHSRELLQRFGLTAPQLAALSAIERLQPISVGALARSIHLSQATLTGVLDRLQRQSLIHRARDANDRRSVVVELTASGAGVLNRAPSLLQDRFRRELGRLHPWERTQMLATLQRIAQMMVAEELKPAPLAGRGAGAANPEDVSWYLTGAVVRDEQGPAPRRAADTGGSSPPAEQSAEPPTRRH